MSAATWEFLKRSLIKINQAKKFFLDLIFPKFCLGCGKEGEWLCRACQKKIIYVKTQVCPDCGRISKAGRFCSRCSKPKGLTGIICASYFEEGPMRELIHNFKYNHILALGDFLAGILVDALEGNLPLKDDFLITPVPLYWLRQSARGYNQAEILAKAVSQRLKLTSKNIIIKKRRTKRQVDLKGKKRRQNLKDVFVVRQSLNMTGKTIILVDDITTTGTTLQECAKVLKRAGARRVWGLVIAKG